MSLLALWFLSELIEDIKSVSYSFISFCVFVHVYVTKKTKNLMAISGARYFYTLDFALFSVNNK